VVVVTTEKEEKPFVILLPVAFQGFENCARKKIRKKMKFLQMQLELKSK